jgi:hypothetical protein
MMQDHLFLEEQSLIVSAVTQFHALLSIFNASSTSKMNGSFQNELPKKPCLIGV